MKNKSYYFSHDGNAHNDIKIQFMCSDLGMEGYGIFWFLIEALFDAGGYLPLKMVKILAKQMNVSEPKAMAVVSNYDLFEISEENFYSNRLLQHFEQRKLLSNCGKRGAKIKWDGVANGVANGVAIDTPMAIKRKGKEKKGKEIKELIIDHLPENYIESVQMQLYILHKKRLEREIILSMWEAFKLEKLKSEKYFKETDAYKHFVNWIKTQKFEINGKQNRYEAIVEYANRYNNEIGNNEENKGLY
jgi:hypothetical protein